MGSSNPAGAFSTKPADTNRVWACSNGFGNINSAPVPNNRANNIDNNIFLNTTNLSEENYG
jgi:hypothetical protein